jgi:hypothetical protein
MFSEDSMLADIDWQQLKKEVTYLPTDSLAELRVSENKIESHPVFLHEATGEYFLWLDKSWAPVDDLTQCNTNNPRSTGFIRFVKIPPKKLFDPLKLKMVEVL